MVLSTFLALDWDCGQRRIKKKSKQFQFWAFWVPIDQEFCPEDGKKEDLSLRVQKLLWPMDIMVLYR
jgi:hypothetical protein